MPSRQAHHHHYHMGHGLSCCCHHGDEHDLFRAAQLGDLDALLLAAADPALAHRRTTIYYDRLSVLHVAAANGQLRALSMLLDRGAHHPDVLSRRKQTPLMLAAKHGQTECVLRLLDAGANILMFDSAHARTCLHHAAFHGHAGCLQAVLSAARASAAVRDTWGLARFVNVRDERGATPLHLAARRGRAECVRLLLHGGAIVSATTARGGSTALHLAARGGDLECVRELLAWGADRLRRDAAGRIAYDEAVAFKKKRRAERAAVCMLLNPSSPEPMVWPSPLKLIAELNPEAKALLQAALREANSSLEVDRNGCSSDDDATATSAESSSCCGICLEQACSMEVEDCGHQMCAACTLALCCHSKPDPKTLALHPPACPFCRRTITRLLVATATATTSSSSIGRSRRSSDRSSSFKEGLTSAIISRIGRGSGRSSVADDHAPLTLDKLAAATMN